VRGKKCEYKAELGMQTLVWSKGRNFPLGRLGGRLMRPRCGNRDVNVILDPPPVVRAVQAGKGEWMITSLLVVALFATFAGVASADDFKSTIVSGLHLKYSRFSETRARDRVRSALRGVARSLISAHSTARAAWTLIGHLPSLKFAFDGSIDHSLKIRRSVDALRTQDERSELFVLLRGPRRSWRPFHFPFAFLAFNLNHFSGSPIM